MEEKKRIQWHSAFCSAMELELREYRQALSYHREYGLNTKPINVDLLIIKKVRDIEMKGQICEIFRDHNIVEYKSPEDGISVDGFSKTLAYAYLYKAMGATADERKVEEITVSIVQNKFPRTLIGYLKQHRYMVMERHKGIYDVSGPVPFRVQMVVTKEVDEWECEWITKLKENLTKDEAIELAKNCSKLKRKDDVENASSVFSVAF